MHASWHMEIDHVTRNHSAHYPDHRPARRLQRARWRPLLRDRVLRRRWPWSGARDRADLGFAWTDMSRRQLDLDGQTLTESWPPIGPGRDIERQLWDPF